MAQDDRSWLIFFFLAALLLYGIDLGGVALRDWDEGTVAQVAREIYQGGTWQGWLFPRLWGDPYWNKPPLMHGLIALVYHGLGVQDGSSRLPGAILSAAAVPLLYQVGREIFPLRLTAILGSAVYLTLLPVVRHGRLAMLDGTAVFFFLILLVGVLGSRRDQRWSLVLALGLAGLGLTKGLLALLLFGIVVVFLAMDTPRLLRTPVWWLGVGLGTLPILLWYGLQGMYWGGSALGVGLGEQGFDRVWTTVERNGGPPWFYLLELLKYAWPWLI
ncbi:MAG: ArnT family glycosyltransferase, partial [Prochlorotrichaceae cyanobacterium]